VGVPDDAMDTLRQWVRDSSNITVLTGAGISTESGIPDFRSPQGIWADEQLMDAMSKWYLEENPEDFWTKYKYAFLSDDLLRAEPNSAHLALAWLEEQGKRMRIYTQNVDGLHQQAGNRHVYEMHGSVRKAHCPICHRSYDVAHIMAEEVPYCRAYDVKGTDCHYILQPDTVLFGQEVRYFQEAAFSMMESDLVLIVGSSLTVYPVADLPQFAKQGRAKVALVNLERTDFDGLADIVIHGKAGAVLPGLL
jgi:NAD-dependent deacetylase